MSRSREFLSEHSGSEYSGIGLYCGELPALRFKKKPQKGGQPSRAAARSFDELYDKVQGDKRIAKPFKIGLKRAKDLHVARMAKPTLALVSVDQALQYEDDLHFLSRFARDYQKAEIAASIHVQICRLLATIGIGEDWLREAFVTTTLGAPILLGAYPQIDVHKIVQIRPLLINLTNAQDRFKGYYIDEDDEFLRLRMIEDTGIPLFDLLFEDLRVRRENLALLRMQIDWLKSKRKEEKQGKNKDRATDHPSAKPEDLKDDIGLVEKNDETALQVDAGVTQVAPADEKNNRFPHLAGWHVFWTDRPFSRQSNHLVAVPTSNSMQAESLLRRVGEGIISIPPRSVLAALAFHLGKDVIQKALSARNKYAPAAMRDWVKIKRGDDRIFLLLPEDIQQTIIFFACGRDVVYRNR